MKIGVVSDTHSHELPSQMIEVFRTVDLIIHAGDFCGEDDYKDFERLKDVKAVYGNMDDAYLRNKLPRRLEFSVEGVAIGVYHGHGRPDQVLTGVIKEFEERGRDLVIFGHSHHAFKKKMDATLYFNPGSPNDFVLAPYPSFGIIEIVDKKIKAKIIKVGV